MGVPYLGQPQELAKPSYSPFESSAGGAEIDPNLLRLLAQRRQKQGLSGPMTTPGQRAPQPAQGLNVQAAPIDPRLRAAMMMRQKLRQQHQQQQAPTYGQAVPRKV